jgi:hypothetical protein
MLTCGRGLEDHDMNEFSFAAGDQAFGLMIPEPMPTLEP